MSNWHVPDRPIHRDLTALSLSAISADAQAIEGTARQYVEASTGVNMRILAQMARAEYSRIIEISDEELLALNMEDDRQSYALLAWFTGLDAGLSVSRGVDMKAHPPEAQVETLDRESVNYMGRGRVGMLFDTDGDKGLAELCASAWFDGCIIGSAFDAYLILSRSFQQAHPPRCQQVTQLRK